MGVLSESSKRLGETTQSAAYNVGGKVTDVASQAGLPPEVAAGAGFAANVGTQYVPAYLTGKLAGAVAKQPLQAAGKRLMQSAVKPVLSDLMRGKAARAIDTLLEKGVNPTPGGMAKLRGLASQLDSEVKSRLAMSPAVIRKSDVGKSLLDTVDQFKLQANPQNDLAAIREAWLKFRGHPLLVGKQEIPVSLAHAIKQGTYKQVGNKAYGELGSADTAAQKAIASGIRNEISKVEPSVAGLNKEHSDLMNALNVTERRAYMQLNNNPAGLALLAQNPQAAAAFMADKSAMFKSLVAGFCIPNPRPYPLGWLNSVSLDSLTRGNRLTNKK